MATTTTTWTHPHDYVRRRRWTRGVEESAPANYGRVVYIDGPDGLPIGFRYENGDAAA